jgi:hypothetical protein
MKDNTSQHTPEEPRKRVFIPHARILSEKDQQLMSVNEKSLERGCTPAGVWLELFCPNDACFTEEERIRLQVFCEDGKEDKDLWLDLFCPENSCEITEASGLP